MSNEREADAEQFLTPADLRSWLQQEIRDATKALELRLRESTDLVAAYSAGNISPKEANQAFQTYNERWGEALPGVTATDGITDNAILEGMDKARQANLTALKRKQRDTRSRGI